MSKKYYLNEKFDGRRMKKACLVIYSSEQSKVADSILIISTFSSSLSLDDSFEFPSLSLPCIELNIIAKFKNKTIKYVTSKR